MKLFEVTLESETHYDAVFMTHHFVFSESEQNAAESAEFLNPGFCAVNVEEIRYTIH
ncbi:MAG: hypothetical protein HKM06_08620 [Spirochaetales bacterium]|nr:hypothetical protein [Spirochaetales bacterium]